MKLNVVVNWLKNANITCWLWFKIRDSSLIGLECCNKFEYDSAPRDSSIGRVPVAKSTFPVGRSRGQISSMPSGLGLLRLADGQIPLGGTAPIFSRGCSDHSVIVNRSLKIWVWFNILFRIAKAKICTRVSLQKSTYARGLP